MVLSDNETKVDFLNDELIANEIVSLLVNAGTADHAWCSWRLGGPKNPACWRWWRHALEGDKDVLCLKFNGCVFRGSKMPSWLLWKGRRGPSGDARAPCGAPTREALTLRGHFPLEWERKAEGLQLGKGVSFPSPLNTLSSLCGRMQDRASGSVAHRPMSETRRGPGRYGMRKSRWTPSAPLCALVDDAVERAIVEGPIAALKILGQYLGRNIVDMLVPVVLYRVPDLFHEMIKENNRVAIIPGYLDNSGIAGNLLRSSTVSGRVFVHTPTVRTRGSVRLRLAAVSAWAVSKSMPA